ncbi:MAG TPA: hypothetical protein VKU41_13305 [Polyangiaceae bacterium]|nr:hypothetical protein [Polyangiaceae bacterium]
MRGPWSLKFGGGTIVDALVNGQGRCDHPSRMRRVLLVFACCLQWAPFLLSCGSSQLKAAGVACSSDSECGAGLACLGIGTFSDAGCSTAARACSKSCAIDSDCAPLGAAFACFLACDGSRSCGATR